MDNPVACVDYSSLYPSSMISQNYSHDSKVWTKTYDLDGNLIKITGERDKDGNFIYDNLPEYQYIDIEFDNYRYIRKNPTSRAEKTKVGHMKCRWAQLPDNQKSIMPSILEELLKARKDTRKMIKTEKDPFMQNILDKRQLGYKVTANSLYGQCGARTSTFYEKDVAASTTATGRMMIMYARRMIEEIYGDLVYDTKCHGPMRCKAEYVYGDTDSVFYTLNLEDPVTGEKIRGQKALEGTIEISKDIEVVCSNYLKPPMFLEYEKTLMPFILLSKKRYVGMLYEDDPNKAYLKYMGLSIKRRDSCDYLKDVYGDILNILMKDNNIEGAIKYLEQALSNLIEGKVSMDKLTITKALKGYYKNPNQIGHKVLADRIGQRDPGNKPKPGDRMKFVFIVNDKPKALMGDKIETPEYIIENKLQIDYTHYITNQLMKPLQQLFGLALEQIWTMQNKRSAIKTHQKDIQKLEDEGYDLETFMKKREKICSAKIKVLLFDKVLSTIYNRKHRIQTLDSFFVKK
jgi:DNA polymerase elongation subunit (family B)